MPRQAAPPRLKQRCVDAIARDMDSWSAGNSRGAGLADGVVSPFEGLTPDLVEMILAALLDQKRLKRRHLEILLRSRVNRLDLSICNKAVSIDSAFFANVSPHLTSLRHLYLDMCKGVSLSLLSSFASRSPHLQTLSLCWTLADDGVVAAVAAHCPALRELSLQGCAGVTDAAVDLLASHALAVALDARLRSVGAGNEATAPAAAPDSVPAAPRLSRLNVSETRVSVAKVRRIFDLLPSICHLQHEDAVLSLCCDESLSSATPTVVRPFVQTLTQTSFSRLKSVRLPTFDSSAADRFVESFPRLKFLVLHTRLTDKALLSLSRLRCLTSLDVYDSSSSLTFAGGVLPLLASSSSSSLRELTLNELDEVDLFAILRFGIELTSLFCLGITSFSDSYSPPDASSSSSSSSSSLRRLRVLPFGENDLSGDQLRRVLEVSPQLTHIHLNNVQVLDDDLLHRLLLRNPLSRLTEACFTDCDGLTGEAVTTLLGLDSDLRLLRLVDCGGVTRSDFQRFVRCIREGNVDARVEVQFANAFSLRYPPI